MATGARRLPALSVRRERGEQVFAPMYVERVAIYPGKDLVGYVVLVENRPGVLKRIAEAIASREVNIEFVTSTKAEEGRKIVQLIVDATGLSDEELEGLRRDVERSAGVLSVVEDKSPLKGLFIDRRMFPLYVTEGVRGVLFRADALRRMFSELRRIMGAALNALLYYQGREYGRGVAGAQLRAVRPASAEDAVRVFADVYQAMGMGFVSRVVGTGSEVVVRIDENWEAEPGAAAEPSCHFTRGMLAGALGELFGAGLVCEETKCASRGDGFCVFRLTPR